MRDSIRSEFGPEGWEVLEEEGRQVTIFTEREQILLVQSVDQRFRVFFDDTVRDDDRATFVRGTDPVHRETSRQTRHGPEQALERLRQVVRDVVLVDLWLCQLW